MSAALIAGRVVDAVAGHGHDVTLRLEGLDEQYFVLGRHPADDTDVVDPGQALRVGHGGEVRPQDGLATDPDLLGDGGPGGDVVAGDHPDPDVGCLGLGHRRLGLGPGRVHHPDQGGHLELLDMGQQVTLGVEADGVEVTLGGGHHPLSGPGHALDVGLRPAGEVPIPRDRGPAESAVVARSMTAGAAPLTKQRTTGRPSTSTW